MFVKPLALLISNIFSCFWCFMVCRSLHQHLATKEQNGLEVKHRSPCQCARSHLVRSSATVVERKDRFERKPSQPASHAIALANLMIPSLPAMRRGGYLRSIVKCMIECMHQCVRTQGLHSNAAP
jgi:hypothetical protein